MGEQIAIVGYGDTGYTGGGFGTRRLGLQKIGEVQDLVFGFESTPAICHGDSGGPSFATRSGAELLIGVHTASSQQCVGWGYDMRVDAFHGWITGAKPQVGFYRAPCGQGYPCLSKLCVAAPDGQERCSQECSSGACPYGDTCVNGKSPTDPPKVCLPLSGGQGALGDPCSAENDCHSGKCVELGAPAGAVCAQACATGKDCPAGFECADRGKGLYCVAVKAADAGAADRGLLDAGPPGDAAPPDASSQSTGGGCVVGGRSAAAPPAAGLACLVIGVLAWRRRCRR
jgi:hypothetical protein